MGEAERGVTSAPPHEATDVLIKRGYKRAAIVGMATGSGTVFQGAITLGVDSVSSAATIVGALLIVLGAVVTLASAAGYRRYTRYRARQVEAVMTRAKRMARGEGACPALLDLGSGGELLRVMAPTDLVLASCDPLAPCDTTPGEPYTNGRVLQADVNTRMGSMDNLSRGKRGSIDLLSTPKANNKVSGDNNPRKSEGGDTIATINSIRKPTTNMLTCSRKMGSSTDNLLDGGLRTIELCPGMVVTPVYLEEWSSTVEVYMSDEHEAPPWRYTDMLALCWLGVFLGSVGLMLVNAGFIVLGVGFESLSSVSVIVMLVVFISVGSVCLVASCVSYHRCHRVYHQYLHSTTSTPSPFDDRASLPQQPAIWQLL